MRIVPLALAAMIAGMGLGLGFVGTAQAHGGGGGEIVVPVLQTYSACQVQPAIVESSACNDSEGH
ncbi:MAG TPA: hypothetical protein VKV57_09150 [bacterium]|nr:hypothetical protein [bacterium]